MFSLSKTQRDLTDWKNSITSAHRHRSRKLNSQGAPNVPKDRSSFTAREICRERDQEDKEGEGEEEEEEER